MDKTKLRWACRRGMLELDLLLLPYFEHNFDQLSLSDQTLFKTLLSEADQDLYAWILNFQACPHENFHQLLMNIRSYHGIQN